MKSIDEILEDAIAEIDPNGPAERNLIRHGVSLRYANAAVEGGLTYLESVPSQLENPTAWFTDRFFTAPQLEAFPDEIQAHLFELTVNMGLSRAAILLQGALNDLGDARQVNTTGRFDIETLGLAHYLDHFHGAAAINNAIVARRLTLYDRIVAHKALFRRFAKGWVVRAKEFT